jgi:hypothetical protein
MKDFRNSPLERIEEVASSHFGEDILPLLDPISVSNSSSSPSPR